MIEENELRESISGFEDKDQIEIIVKDFKKFSDFLIKKYSFKDHTQVTDLFDKYMTENSNIDETIEKLFENKSPDATPKELIQLAREEVKTQTYISMYKFIISEDYPDKKYIDSSIALYIEIIS